MAAPTFSAPVMRVLASFGQPPESGSALSPAWRALPNLLPRRFPAACSPARRSCPPRRGDPRRMTNLFCIGRDNAGGQCACGEEGWT